MKAAGDLLNVLRGFLMGGADIIPGVSGGTVALILGIYDRLVTAISRFDLTLLKLLAKRRWRTAAVYIDLRFLITLGCGVLVGIGGLASVMHYLLLHQRQSTLAVFFGMILASTLLVSRMVPRWTPKRLGIFLSAGVAAFILVGLPLLKSPPAGNGYVFLSATIAICAMILPGISGAFILLILGKYEDITGLLRELLHGTISLDGLETLGIFVLGAGLGLLGFSKLLRWLLSRHEAVTLSLLCGLMLGSLRRIWPFQIDRTPEITELKHKVFDNVWPRGNDGEFFAVILLMAVAAGFVMLLDWMTSGHEKHPHLQDESSGAK